MSGGTLDFKDLERRMHGAVTVLKSEFGGLRTGRASISLLEPIMVDAYGASMPIDQLATISVPEPRMLSVQVWDRGTVNVVDKAIRESNLGLNPVVDGQLLRIPIPELNAERRQELIKIAHKYAEQARVAARHVRKDGMDQLKRMEKDSEISKDEHHEQSERVQKLTDETIADIDKALAVKEDEIKQV
ncbi:MAG: ribosome recycling factor [Hyphomicrobiales bacterium]|nr:ribosome recycling factor [Hyphomicrobiales bacterium]